MHDRQQEKAQKPVERRFLTAVNISEKQDDSEMNRLFSRSRDRVQAFNISEGSIRPFFSRFN
jgi:hypothetical protein